MWLGGYQSRSAHFGDPVPPGIESRFLGRPVSKFSPCTDYAIPAHQPDNWYCKLCACLYMGREQSRELPDCGQNTQRYGRPFVQHTRWSWGRNSRMPTGISWSWNNVVGIATKLLAGRSRVRILAGARDLLFSKTSRPALGPTQHPIERVLGFFQGIKRPGREIDHSSLSTAQVKNEWSYTSTAPI
jgi:hypothetical protein